jgi:putative tryptophan/tyrosine transport system substrate-binding protein
VIPRRAFATGALGLVLAPLAARAQARRRPLVGHLVANVTPVARIAALLDALRQLGWDEGRDFDFISRSASGFADRLPALARELIELGPTVLVVGSSAAAQAARRVTSTIPIVVISFTGDPIALGFAQSIPHPGGNVTGLLGTLPGLFAKLLQLAHELVPSATRIGVLLDRSSPALGLFKNDADEAARVLKLTVVPVAVGGARDEVEGAIASLVQSGVGAMAVSQSPILSAAQHDIAAAAARARLPAIYSMREFVAEAGGLVSYGINLTWNHRQAALYVDKILRGSKAGDLPFEFPSRLEMVLNVRAAKALGIEFPESFWIMSTEVIQ